MSANPVLLDWVTFLQARAATCLSRRGSGVFLAFLSLQLAGCLPLGAGATITGSGQAVTRQFDFNAFSVVAAASAFQVEITQGAKHSVTIQVDDNIMEHLEVTCSGDTLRLGIKPNLGLRGATLKATITMPLLTGLNLSGATKTTLAAFASRETLHVTVSGASSLRGEIKAGAAWFDVSGASHLQLRGSTESLKAKVSGASHVDFERFNSTETVAEASGASHLTVHATGDLVAKASGASSVRYVGTPASLKEQTSGASSVSPK